VVNYNSHSDAAEEVVEQISSGGGRALAGRKEDEVQAAVELVNSRSVLGHGAGEPEDIASVIEFLASEDSRFMTGQLLMADGGRMDYLSHV